MSDLLIEFAELIYPNDFNKQTQLMHDIVNNMGDGERLADLTPIAFRKAYEESGCVPLLPESHLDDMFVIMGRKWDEIRKSDLN